MAPSTAITTLGFFDDAKGPTLGKEVTSLMEKSTKKQAQAFQDEQSAFNHEAQAIQYHNEANDIDQALQSSAFSGSIGFLNDPMVVLLTRQSAAKRQQAEQQHKEAVASFRKAEFASGEAHEAKEEADELKKLAKKKSTNMLVMRPYHSCLWPLT